MDDWMDGLDWDSGDDWDSGSWDDAWDFGGDNNSDMSDMGYDWDSIFGSGDSGGDQGTSWWNSFTGNNGQSTNWMNMLLAGYSQYQGQQNNEQSQRRGFENDRALAILRDQLQNKEWDRRQGLLSDAYKGYEQYGANTPGDISGLSAYKPKSLLQGSGYYGY